MRDIFPVSTEINRFLAKQKFYDNPVILVSSKTKSEFQDKISKITITNKLAADTINVPATKEIATILVVQVNLKSKDIPRKAILVMARAIQAPVLFTIIHDNNFCYAIPVFENSFSTTIKKIEYSPWGKDLSIDLIAINLRILYEKLATTIIGRQADSKEFEDTVSESIELSSLSKEISSLQNKLKKEKQAHKQQELHHQLVQARNRQKELINS